MNISDIIPLRKTSAVWQEHAALELAHRFTDSWWVFRGRVFGYSRAFKEQVGMIEYRNRIR